MRFNRYIKTGLLIIVACGFAALLVLPVVTSTRPTPAKPGAAFAAGSRKSAVGTGTVTLGSAPVTSSYGSGVTSDTPFILGSVSKNFTAAATLQLVDAAKLQLDAPIRTYLPNFHTADTAGDGITIRHLLSHTSGISGAETAKYLTGAMPASLEARVDNLSRAKLISNPGEAFNYSNENYALLGMIIQKVSGVSYGQYIQTHIFQPLDMKHSHTDYQAAKYDGLVGGYRNFFGLKLRTVDRSTDAFAPDGYLISTTSDMLTYLEMQLNDGRYKDRQILSARSAALMQRADVAVEPDDSPFSFAVDHYGMGWASARVSGEPVLVHGGDVKAYHAAIGLIPRTKTAVVVMVNENGMFSQAPGVFTNLLSSQLPGDVDSVPERSYFYGYFNLTFVLSILLMSWRLFRRTKSAQRARSLGGRGCVVKTLSLRLLIIVVCYATVMYVIGPLALGDALSLRLIAYGAPDVSAWLVLLALLYLATPVVWLLQSGGDKSQTQ